MNVTVISTPDRDAYLLGEEGLKRIEREGARIASIEFASFLKDIDMLAVALYASHPSLCAHYLSYPITDYRRKAAEKAKGLHFNPQRIPHLVHKGFFNRQVHLLLEVGNHNADYGAKLFPVFAVLLEHQDEHHISATLVEDIHHFMAKRDFVDGFVLVEQTPDSCCITPGLWTKKAA